MTRDYVTKVREHKLTLNGHSICPFCGETACNDQFPVANGMAGYHVKCVTEYQPVRMVYGKTTTQKRAKRHTITQFKVKVTNNPVLKAYLLYNGYMRMDSKTFVIECYSYQTMRTLNEARNMFPNDIKAVKIYWFDADTQQILHDEEFKSKAVKTADIIGYCKVIKARLEGIATSHTTDSKYFQ